MTDPETPRLRLSAVLLTTFSVLETAMIWWRIQAAPLAWICLVWLVVAGILFVVDRRPIGRILWPNLAAVLIAIGAVEGALYVGKSSNPYVLPPGVRFVGDLARPNYFIEMPVAGLGYRARQDMRIQAVKKDMASTIYSARYSVDHTGLRKSPQASADVRACVFMFGDSMAWGEGVDDEQTAAYQIGMLAGADVKVANFAFTGYSAHQMLWQATSGMVPAFSGCPSSLPVLAIYQTLPNNIGRVAGLRGWDQFGPRYLLGPDGQVRYEGSFAGGEYVLHDRFFVPAALATQFDRINLYSRIFGRDRAPDAFDDERFSVVVRTAAASLKSRYPRLQFVVLVWSEPSASAGEMSANAARLLDSLRQHGLTAMGVDDILPWYRTDPGRADIPGDGHPNAATHLLIAQYFAPLAIRMAAGAGGERPAGK